MKTPARGDGAEAEVCDPWTAQGLNTAPIEHSITMHRAVRGQSQHKTRETWMLIWFLLDKGRASQHR